MSAMGDLLEAIHDAPRAERFSGSALNAHEPNMIRRAMERHNERRGAQSTRTSVLRVGSPGPPGPVDALVMFWHDGDRWRLDRDRNRTIGTPEATFHFNPGQGGVIDRTPPTQFMAGMATFFRPASLLGALKFVLAGEVEWLGRPCWSVSTQLREWEPGGRPVFLHEGEDFDFLVDQELGVILRSEGTVDGQFVSRFEMRELTTGQPIPAEVFAFLTPDGSATRSRGEMMLELLRNRGIDVSGIDPDDDEAVRRAMHGSMPLTLGQPQDVDLLGAHHIPNGPPPDDEDAAREQIAHAFQFMGEKSLDGRALVNVELGSNLGPCQSEIERRFPNYTGPGERPLKIKFMNPHEAVVWTNTPIGLREGRAVLVDGTWKVSRSTFCGNVAMGGVVCPPPPE